MRCACCPTGFHAHLIQCVFIGWQGGSFGLHLLASYVILFPPPSSLKTKEILPHFSDKDTKVD